VRIARFATGDGVAYGVVEGEGEQSGLGLVIAELHGHPFGVQPDGVRYTGNRYPLAEVRLLAPVLPSKVVAVAGNYEGPDEPEIYLRPSTSVTGAGERIAWPVKLTERLDCGGELAVIIGRLCREVPRDRADDVVFGYACATDVTARDLIMPGRQWTRAKGFDTFCPLGPWISTETDPADLELVTTVNGIERQRARTSGLRWDIPSVIAYVSQIMTLLPGDVLLTGSPSTVGPLAPDDEISVTISTIGTLTNKLTVRD
jgi:2-keto-4-pentenoate hydratase/2-oxohepta-3-ene-1,7-dioic acid hydratase in catechol pathway